MLGNAPADASGLRGPRLTAPVSASARKIRGELRRREPRLVLGLAALGVAGTSIPGGALSPLRVILVAPLVLFAPGYALTSAIFTRRVPPWADRVALALGLSVVTTALVSVFLHLTPFALTLYSWAVSLALVTAVAVVAGAARTPARPDTSKLSPPPLALSPVGVAAGVAAAGLLAAAFWLARTPLSSPSAPGYTALWLTRAQNSSAVRLGVRSEEHRRTRYVLRLVLRGRVTSRRLELGPGETWQITLPAARRAKASLYRVGHHGVYRSVRLSAP